MTPFNHTHPYAEVVTVISGTVGFGMGEKFDPKGEMSKAGALYANPAKHGITFGLETRRRLSKFSSSGQEVSTTSTRPTIHARRRSEAYQL